MSTPYMDEEAVYAGPPFERFQSVDASSVTMAMNILVGYVNQAAALSGGAALTTGDITDPTDLTLGAVSGQLIAQAVAAAVGPRNVPFTTPGQTAFNLPTVPVSATTITFAVNGMEFDFFSGAFTFAGSTITWLNLFTLDPATDTVVVRYV